MTPEITNFMQFALEQAFFAIGESRPNPAVGAVVVKDGIVVGKGRTQRPGSAHAEVMALRDAGELARGASIFVTLEPCCHYGRTPPCTKAIIEAGIQKVYFAHSDPNPVVHGKSRKILEEAGVEVHEGVDACILACVEDCSNGESCTECRVFEFTSSLPLDKASREAEGRAVFAEVERYFEAYDYFVRTKRTFVEVKSAVSQDGFMGCVDKAGNHLPLAITKQGANCWNHELRAMSDAVLVGAGTLLADNPGLDVRYAAGNNPVKIVWAGHHEFTADEISRLKIFSASDAKPIVFSCVAQPKLLNVAECVVLLNDSFAENWRAMVDDLSARGMHRLMVEPGARLARELFNGESLWNRLDLWRSTDSSVDISLENLIESGVVKAGLEYPELPANIVAKESAVIGPDVLTVYYPG
ncbi:bifunctional diaminohydroxyphosphoribosylaminopyrimidine deaminase/5-amino-6-(5-phosphoribosylamino)uracil reductase RibD [Fibrobacter sp. UWB13]|uniref:bifunctional diaminohydroxyphosphoribosylaminopyrimidine deaminase/5-amino-6-(5-phosphoribosylamino)uracil reductase RibD n=1 Tax=Fibrobacter sp. UWB13 TaxID=1896204 RepID=UPI000A1CD64C|nr:bifunctional diaminohydroxyphosphoribosylaminopyrimidine deaminase/5-amino-6-(5-phosphoribosylamino)uracil reductase RibD [Fibrobacter sp. UWB13]